MPASLPSSPQRVGPLSSVATPRAATRRAWYAAWLLWLGALAWGGYVLFLHASTPGAAGAAPTRFPVRSEVPRAAHGGTLLMFVHPECPCTAASLHELERILREPHGAVTPVLVVAPSFSQGSDWSHSKSAPQAARIPGLKVFHDQGEREAGRFGALTSGHVVLYSEHGKLLFAGGITGSRGHRGDNMGARTLRALLDAPERKAQQHAVFGCALRGDGVNAGLPVP